MLKPTILLPLVCGCLSVGDTSDEPPVTNGSATTRLSHGWHEDRRSTGVVTGNIYDAIDADPATILSDIHDVGVKWIRIEINNTDYDKFERIADRAAEHDLNVLAVVQQNSLPNPDPNIEVYAGQVKDLVMKIDRESKIHYFEIQNEPDIYNFPNLADYAVLMTRVYENVVIQRGAETTPRIVGFSFSRYDDDTSYKVVWNAQAIQNHRNYFRQAHSMADGLPCDIVAIHGYGNDGKLPNDAFFTYKGDGIDGGLNRWFGRTFDTAPDQRTDGERTNRSLLNGMPVWFTEFGFDRKKFGDSETKQADGLEQELAAFKARDQIEAAFYYDYRDDANSAELDGLESDNGLHKNEAYARFQTINASWNQ